MALKTCELCGKDFRGGPKRRFCSTTCSARFSAGPRRKYFTAEELREARRRWARDWWAKNRDRFKGRTFKQRPELLRLYGLRKLARLEACAQRVEPIVMYRRWDCMLDKEKVMEAHRETMSGLPQGARNGAQSKSRGEATGARQDGSGLRDRLRGEGGPQAAPARGQGRGEGEGSRRPDGLCAMGLPVGARSSSGMTNDTNRQSGKMSNP